MPVGGWTGRDVYDQDPLYTLELTHGEVGGVVRRRGLMHKWIPVPGTKSGIRPASLDFDNLADAAGHLGFKYFRGEDYKFGQWIIEMTDEESELYAQELERADPQQPSS